ncbi:MAG: GHMP kinase [Chloroflexi bacterium]|nr:GHMP kinase [Chloroflexota bacterium]
MPVTTAPTRIDLAGGTLDIYPLYLFEEGALTVNMAVDINSVVRIEKIREEKILIESEDLDIRLEAEDAGSLSSGSKLELIVRAVRFYDPSPGIRIVTKSNAPPGSGLGASSSLLMALMCALNHITEKKQSLENIIEYGANLEAQAIKVPTGKQDYYAAVYGGVNAWHFGVEGVRREKIVPPGNFMEKLKSGLILTFTGQSHFSANQNWDMMKRYIDGDPVSRKNMKRIKEIAFYTRDALNQGDITALSDAINEEWKMRRALSDGVSTPVIEKMMKAAADAGALANKICGAGGGGCMLTLCPGDKKEEVESALKDAGGKVLDFSIDEKGVSLREE